MSLSACCQVLDTAIENSGSISDFALKFARFDAPQKLQLDKPTAYLMCMYEHSLLRATLAEIYRFGLSSAAYKEILPS